MRKVKALTKYSQNGASSRVRFASLTSGLVDLGWDVSWSPLLSNKILEEFYRRGSHRYRSFLRSYLERVKLLREKCPPDLWWVEKEFFYGVPWRLESLLVREKLHKTVIDYDDGVFLNYSNEHRYLHGRLAKFPAYAKNAACITYGSEGIRKHLSGWGCQRLVKVPSSVDIKKYSLHKYSSTSVFTIGWIGTPVNQPMLELLREPLLKLSKKVHFKMIIIGADWNVPGIHIESRPWSENTESRDVAALDVGVMPLKDLEWERCKCGYKLIQYMAAGVVPVGSSVGENRNIVQNAETGFLCRSELDWYNALFHLASNRADCVRMSLAARAAAERRFDVSVAVKLVDEAFRVAVDHLGKR